MGYSEEKILNFLVENLSFGGAYILFGIMGKRKLKEFLKILSCHPTINFTAEYSLDKVNFFRCRSYLVLRKQTPYRYTYQTYGYSPIEFSACHVYNSRKSIPYSQAFCFNSFLFSK